MLTLVSCWYELKSKFNRNIYNTWISNLLLNVVKFNLVIYTNITSKKLIEPYINNNRIKVVIKDTKDFYNYKYKSCWIKNHKQNALLNNKICWELNMLWSEKISFVKHAYEQHYFDTELYGWCDIGYFRGRVNDIDSNLIKKWPGKNTMNNLNQKKIHYANVCNNTNYNNSLFKYVMSKNNIGLPQIPIPPNQCSIAGGFFILHKNNINWWWKTYDERLQLYFNHNYLVKDDQIILVDCVLNNLNKFQIHKECNPLYDNWFMFQRILL
jgi:hypothetical protein